MKKSFILLILFLFGAISLSANKKYCNSVTELQRATSIYLDLGNTNEKKFAKSLMVGLKNNFLPHERVQIFTINPEDSSINLIFNSCAPKLTQQEIKKVKSEGTMKYMLGGNPIDTAKEDMSFFMASIKSTLIKVYKNNVANNYDSKALIEMLYNESSNFEDNPMQRVVLYSDMLQNSSEIKLDSIFKDGIAQKISEEYKTNFNFAEFYIFTAKKQFGISKYNKLSKFWKEYFELNKAYVVSFNDNLKLPKIKALGYKKYEGKLLLSGKSYESQIFINYTSKLNTSNSWFIINEIDAIPLVGKVKYSKGKLISANLKIGKINGDYHTMFAGDEKFKLKFKGKKLIGVLKIDNAEIILNGEVIKDPTFKIDMKEI